MAVRNQTVAAQQARFGATAGLYTVVVIAILVVVNWLGNVTTRLTTQPATSDSRLSQETEKTIKGLKQPPPSLTSTRRAALTTARRILDRYKNLSSKVSVQYVDYQAQPTVAKSFGLRFPGTAYVAIGPRREEAKL